MIAHKIIIGNLPAFGIKIFGIAGSIAPKETPFVAYVTRPKMINMFAIVEMNGCILNLAIKNPAIIANTVVRMIHTPNANNDFGIIPILEKSKMWPNTPPVLIPLCIIMVAVTIPIPTIRPTERSVPVKRIRPATPSARNIRGEACCKIFRIFVAVKSCVFFTIGVMIHSAIKIRIITIYRPFLYRNCVILNVYL